MHVHMVHVLLNACTTIKFGSMKWKIDSTSSIVAHIVRNCGKYLLFVKGKLWEWKWPSKQQCTL